MQFVFVVLEHEPASKMPVCAVGVYRSSDAALLAVARERAIVEAEVREGTRVWKPESELWWTIDETRLHEDCLPMPHAMIDFPEPDPEALRCVVCGAVEGKPHHDPTTGGYIVKLRRSRLRSRLECQACNAGIAQVRSEEKAKG